MEMNRIDRGAREEEEDSSESPHPPSSPPNSSYHGQKIDSPKNVKETMAVIVRSPVRDESVASSPLRHDKPRRKRRSGSRTSSTRSHKRSRSRDRDKDRERDKDSRSRKHSRRDRSRSRSRGRSRSKERRRSRSPNNKSRDRGHRYRDSRRYHRQNSYESDLAHDDVNNDVGGRNLHGYAYTQSNAFKNDGSFMEMFKKMQEQMPNSSCQPASSSGASTTMATSSSSVILQEKTAPPPPLMVGKRRGGRILKTGMVAKPKTEPTADQPKDAWSLYMAEVKKYREVCCQEEDNTRPLVK